MNSRANSLMITGAGLATAAAVFAASPVVQFNRDLTIAPTGSVTSPVELLSLSLGNTSANAGGVGMSALVGIITSFLDNNQQFVLGVTGMIPPIALGPVTIGNALLANAYYSGFNGSATGVPGVLSYVADQLGTGGGSQAELIKNIVLSLTAQIPTFNLGPVAIGGSVLADAYFNGYNGSPTGVPGIIAYVIGQLQFPTPAAGATTLTAGALATGSQSDLIKGIVLKLTAQIPKFYVGPVQIGGSILANAYFNGYNGSPTGLNGIIAYVTSQLGIPTPAAATLASRAARPASTATRTALPAATSLPKPAENAAAISVPVASSVTNDPAPVAATGKVRAAAAKARLATTTPSDGAKPAASTRGTAAKPSGRAKPAASSRHAG